jgi:nuclear pore complex protein Nup188
MLTLLSSWDDLFEALFSHDHSRAQHASRILSGDYPKRILSSKFPSFPRPNASSKAAFDSAVSAISSSSNGLYNRDELKEDAAWLSKQVDIGEQEALRLALLEWQYRPESRLREGYSEAEIASLKEALGSDYVDRYLQAKGSFQARDDAVFNTQQSRRTRLIRLHLSQQVLVLRLGKELTEINFSDDKESGSSCPCETLATELRAGVYDLKEDIADGINRTETLLQSLESGPSWEIEDSDLGLLKDARDTCTLQMIGYVLETLLLVVRRSDKPLSSESVRLWFRLMSSVGFFAPFTSEIERQTEAIQKIQSTASLLSLTILNVGLTITTLVDTASSGQLIQPGSRPEYCFDLETASHVHELLYSAASAGNMLGGPAILAWAMIIYKIQQLASFIKEKRESQHVQRTLDAVSTFDAATGRRGSGGGAAFQASIFEDLLDTIMMHSTNDDPSSFLLDAALGQCNVVDYIALLSSSIGSLTTLLPIYKVQALQDVIKIAQSLLGYTPELISSQLALLAIDADSRSEQKLYDPIITFLEDEDLLRGFYDTAAARFPYECLPFLQFSRALARVSIFSDDGTQYVEYRLRKLTSLTRAVGKDVEYTTTREDESGSFVALEAPVNLLDFSQNKLLTYTHQETGTTSIVPAETIGELISDPDAGGPTVIRWQHEFSGLAYMGQLLELHYMGLLAASLSPSEDLEGVVSETIGVLATLLSTILNNNPLQQTAAELQDHCAAVLDEFSSHLNPEADVILYIFDILEQELQRFRRRTVSTFDSRIMTACLDFIIVLTNLRPESIWSNLNRTSLLGHQSASSPILAIVSGVDVPLQIFDFLEKCTELYHSLIGLALKQAITNAPTIRPVSRSKIPAAWRVQNPMLVTPTEVFYQIFQGIPDWSFQFPEQQLRISTSIANSFSDIIQHAFGVGASFSAPSIAAAPFAGAATFLVSAFRASGSQDLGSNPVAQSLFATSTGGKTFLLGDGSVLLDDAPFERYVRSQLSLATLLVRYSLVRELPLSPLEKHIFDAVPALVRTLQVGSSVRTSCLGLLRNILVYVERHQPSSLLGHLGSSSCIDLLNFLQHVDANSESPQERAEVWKLLSQLVKDSQQWLAMVTLTGSVPDGSKRKKSDKEGAVCIRSKTFLQIAMDELKSIERLPRKVAIAMLDFVLQAQQDWSWVTQDLSSSKDFFSKVVQSATKPRTRDPNGTSLADGNLIAARVTDIATTHLHHAIIARDMDAIKTYIPLINWLALNAVEVSSYNASLHGNMRRNFAAKYNGLTVADIKSTGLSEREYGPNFYYDIEFANKLLERDSSWQGAGGRSSDQSFSAEFRRANTNLSVIDSEFALLSSLQRLCIDHCKFFVRDREVHGAMVHIIQHCLEANSQLYPTEALFESLFKNRADLSMALLRELVATGAKGSDMVGLLEHAWGAVRFRSGTYEQAIINNDLAYWRSILSVLLMTLQIHVNLKRKSPGVSGGTMAIVPLDPETPTFLEITSIIVAEGFRSVVVAIQDQKENRPKTDADDETDRAGLRDISILLTLMQAILRLPSLPQFAAELSDRLSSSGIISSCLILYSWSHLLGESETDSQPRYADYCVQLLASISSLPLVAEELAIEGVLNRILSAKTTDALQRVPGGVSHADNRRDCAFLYRVWATGLLPLCLNLLHAVGGAIAPEVSVFLNRFPDQLIRASTSLMPTPQAKAAGADVLTLGVASEAATLALISYGLASYREAGASAAVDPTTILPLKGYDEHRKAIVEDLRDLIAMKDDARRKITVPTDEKELTWQGAKDGDKLDAKIVKELKIAVAALSRDEDDDEK